MRVRARLAFALLVALACAGTAGAAFVPRLVVAGASHSLGGAGAVSITFSQKSAPDAALARLTVYAAPGYIPTLTQPRGSRIGSARATFAPTAGAGQSLSLTGELTALDPAAPVGAACATGKHQAVWLLSLASGTVSLTVPVYVDPVTAGIETALGSTKLELCLPSPDVPAVAGGAPGRLTSLVLTIRGVFRNPATRGDYRWVAFSTPYFAGTDNANTLGTKESRAIVGLPVVLSLKGTYRKRTRSIRINGSLRQNAQGVDRARVRIYVKKSGSFRLVRTVRTNAAGRFTARIKAVRRTTHFRAKITVGARNYTAAGCAGPSLAPGGCSAATLQPFTVATATRPGRR